MHANRKRPVDWIALALFSSLVIIGWLMIYAAGFEQGQEQSLFSLNTPAGKQLLFIGVGVVLFIAVYIIDDKFWHTFSYPMYAISILSLVLVLILGSTIKGSTSWFSFAGFSLQPSEFAKLGTCLAMAAYLSYYRTDLKTLRYQAGAIAILTAPAALILLQPDAGSALVFTSFFLVLYRQGMPSLLYIAGVFIVALFVSALLFPPFLVIACILALASILMAIQLKNSRAWVGAMLLLTLVEILLWENLIPLPVIILNTLLLLITMYRSFNSRNERSAVLLIPAVVLSVAMVFSVSYAFNKVLEPHQQDRINVWLRPEQCDPQGSLYNVLHSKIAIGSGGLEGKGFLKGSMTNLNYVPEQTTDFIFSTIGEEQGFIGSAGIILIYTLLIIRIVRMGERMRSGFNQHYAYGFAGLLFFHFFINIGMTMGLVPIIGIPLPFISYGGSSLLAFTIMMAVLMKMDRSRFESR